MTLSFHPKVWRVLLGIGAALTALFFLAFAFVQVTLALVCGAILVNVARKLSRDFRERTELYQLPSWALRWRAYFITVVWTFAVIYLIGGSLDQLSRVFEKIDSNELALSRFIESKVLERELLPRYLVPERFLEERVPEIERSLLDSVRTGFTHTASFLLNCLLIIPLMFYASFSRQKPLMERVVDLIPGEFRTSFERAAKEIERDLREYTSATVLRCVVVGMICVIGFYVAGVKGWLLLGILAGALNVVPYFGPVLGAIPPVILSMFVKLEDPSMPGEIIHGDIVAAGLALLTVVVANVVENFYLIPFVTSRQVDVSPLLTVIIILVGAELAGPVGMVFAVPIYLIYKVVLREAYLELVRVYDPARFSHEFCTDGEGV